MSEEATSEKGAALAAYNDVVEHSELGDIRLLGLNFYVRPSYFSDEDKKKRKARFDCEIKNIAHDEERGILGGTFEWKVSITESRSKVLVIEANYLVIYDNVPNVAHAHSEAFLRKVGRFATYPYLRGIVSQLSWASKADLPTLPILR